MRYMLLMHYPEASAETIGAEAMEAGRREFAAYAATLEQAGVLLAGQVLAPSSASTTVRLRDGELLVQDGPFADTKDQLGGIILVDVPDLDAAIGWARRAPSVAWGAVEVRPGAVHTDGGRWVPSS